MNSRFATVSMKRAKRRRICDDSRRNWSELPHELLQMVMTRLTAHGDGVRVGLVCKWWHSVRTSCAAEMPRHPLLMFLPHAHYTVLHFLDPVDKSVHRICLPLLFDMIRTYVSSQGWLFVVDRYWASLINPWSKEVLFGLPSLNEPSFSKNSIVKAATSSELISYSSSVGCGRSCLVAIICGARKLGFAELKDKKWRIRLAVPSNLNHKLYFEDVIYCRNRFYAISLSGHIVVCPHFEAHRPRLIDIGAISRSIGEDINRWKKYLVYSDGELLAVLKKEEMTRGRGGYYTGHTTHKFRVFCVLYDIDHENGGTGGLHVKELHSLKGHALFLGINTSISLPAQSAGCRPNCIYFSDDSAISFVARRGGDQDVGVYNMEDGTVDGLSRDFLNASASTSMWITPTIS